MIPQNRQQAAADPWHDKGERHWLIAALVFLSYLAFAAYDGQGFHTRYLRLCSEQPGRVECRPLNLVKEERKPDLGITLDYGKGKWALEVGTRQEEKQKNDLVSQFRFYGIEPRVIEVFGKGKRVLYKVQVGRFPNRKSATDAGVQLKGKGLIQDFTLVEYQAMK
jgi:hypothetical protein